MASRPFPFHTIFAVRPLLDAFPFDRLVVIVEGTAVSATLDVSIGNEYRCLWAIAESGQDKRLVCNNPVQAVSDLFGMLATNESCKLAFNVSVQFYSKGKPFPAEWLHREWDPQWTSRSGCYPDLLTASTQTLWHVAAFRRGTQFEDALSYCMHIGCANMPTKFYKMQNTYDESGMCFVSQPHTVFIRHFCDIHCHRGNRELDDCDANMIEISRGEIDL